MTFLKMKKADGRTSNELGALESSTDRRRSWPKKTVPEKKARLGAPPDGGWGWVVALSSFSISLLVDGVCFSFGIFFDDFRKEFKATTAATSWIGSTLNGSYLIFGPIVSALVNIYGCRRVAMCGSILASVAFFCSSYTHHIGTLIFTFGFLGGIGFGLMYLPAIVIVGYYFERRRALATGIACCGSGIGAFLFAPFSEFLLNEYGWRGATWIISGLVLNGFMFALFYRPLPGPTIEQEVSSDMEFDVGQGSESEVTEGTRRPLDLLSFTSSSTLTGKGARKKAPMNAPTLQRLQQQLDERGARSPPALINNDLLVRIKQDLLQPSVVSGTAIYRSSSVILHGDGKVKDEDAQFRSDIVRMTRSQDLSPVLDNSAESKKSEPIRIPYLQRKDIFYSGNISQLKEYQELGSLEKFRHEMISTTPTPSDTPQAKDSFSNETMTPAVEGHGPSNVTVTVSRPTMREAMGSIFDFQLLKSPTFLVYGLSCFLCMAGFFVPFTYMPDHAIGLGLDTQSAAFLISIIGITNTVGRVAVGFISDQPWADCLLINNVALMIGGAVTVFVPYYTHYSILAIYSAVFGSAIAVFVSLRSIIMVELMGLEKLTTAFGFVIMFQGISSLLGSPIAGALSDATGNYNAAFYMAGITLFLSGVMCIPLKHVARWEARRTESRLEEERKRKEEAELPVDVVVTKRNIISNNSNNNNNNGDIDMSNDNNDDANDNDNHSDECYQIADDPNSALIPEAVPMIKVEDFS